MIDPESSINSARVVALQSNGHGTGRCLWGHGGTEQCAATLSSGLFCPEHVDEILSSEDLDVLSAWGRLQGDVHRAKKAEGRSGNTQSNQK